MPRIVDYEIVLARMEREGFKCVYHNSGAFAFGGGEVRTVAWIGPEDSTIREEARAFVKTVPPPYASNLAEIVIQAWERMGGTVWLMPKSHWAHELNFGSDKWMPEALRKIGVDAEALRGRANAAAIEFTKDERELLRGLMVELLENLVGSDFMLAFPGRGTLCTVHHHQQVWWQTNAGGIFIG
jgi:hypothetical protein